MPPAHALVFPALIATSVAGVALLGWTLSLPWHNPYFGLPPVVRMVMAAAGVALLVLVGRSRQSVVALPTAVLGLLVLLYPTFLGLGAAYPEDTVAGLLSATGHVAPIILMQLIPVLASSAAAGRTRHGREMLVIAFAATGVACTAAGTLGGPGAEVFAGIGGVIWIVQLTIAPVITGLTVHALQGEARRRAVLAALAAIVPVALIATCQLLGAAAEGLGLGVDGSIIILMLGFSVATLACGALSIGSTAATGSRTLRSGAIIAALDSLLIALVAIVVVAAALLAAALEVSSTGSVAIGAAVAAVGTVAWQRSRNWTARLVDPASAFRRELRAAGAITDGEQRRAALHALRRATDDRALQLRFRVGADLWVDENGEVGSAGPLVIARREDAEPTVGVIASDESGELRITAQGDCSALLGPALFEAQLAHESHRADLAADTERLRLQRNLHDGLQGQLLGLALGLQLSGRSLDDPSARLLIAETVGALRCLVDDVRALGGGDLPAVLQSEGLEPALRALLAPVSTVVSLDIPAARFDRSFEEIAYFVVGEAVTNALKHADAHRISVRIAPGLGDGITVTVSDDGCGGADPRAGTGLRSLAERVTASGGTFLVRDDLTRGTVVEAVLSCGS